MTLDLEIDQVVDLIALLDATLETAAILDAQVKQSFQEIRDLLYQSLPPDIRDEIIKVD